MGGSVMRARPVFTWATSWLGRTAARLGLLVMLAAVALASPGVLAQQVQQAKSLTAAQPIQTKARNAILMEAATGAVLLAHQADDLIPPASMSKLLSGIWLQSVT